MSTAELFALGHRVLWAAFLIGIAFGALVQRTGFCTMGAVADAVALGDTTRLRQWALAAATAILGFGCFAAVGWVSAPQTLYASTRWLWASALVGGALFGFGMVLASGCLSKTLVRVGGGNLKSLVVLLVAAIAGFATLKGLTALWRTHTVDRVAVDLGRNADLATLVGAWTGMAPAAAALVVAAVAGGALLAWALATREARLPLNLVAGFGVGGLALAMWWTTGHLGHLAEHPQTLEEAWLATNSGRAEGLTFVAPAAYALDWLLFTSDANKRVTAGIAVVAGVVLGSAAMALTQRTFRWEGFGGTADLAHHLAGAVLMGVGGVTAVGCSIGQGISGVSTLHLTSLVAAAAMLAGAAGGVKYQAWRIERGETRRAALA